jgi:hypothetical protein
MAFGMATCYAAQSPLRFRFLSYGRLKRIAWWRLSARAFLTWQQAAPLSIPVMT